MKPLIEYQTLLKNGKPEYVIIPYQQFHAIFAKYLREKKIPQEVMNLMADKNISRVRAWREYLNFTQAEIAKHIGVTQAALSQMEIVGAKLRKTTLIKLAGALKITVEQLR
jgi:DNA-binding XRE family transcriptional regulator